MHNRDASTCTTEMQTWLRIHKFFYNVIIPAYIENNVSGLKHLYLQLNSVIIYICHYSYISISEVLTKFILQRRILSKRPYI